MRLRFVCAFGVLFTVGCGTSAPPPVTPSSVTTNVTPQAVESPTEPTTKPEESPAKPPPETKPKPPTVVAPQLEAALRSRLAALIVPGTGSSWQVVPEKLAEVERNPPTVDVLLLAATEADPAVRRGAWHQLADRLDATNEAQRASLATALADQDAIVRALALKIVNELSEEQVPPLVPALAKLLLREDLPAENRAAIARLFGRLRTEAKVAADALAQAAKDDKQPRVRTACLVALAHVAEPADNVPRFQAALADTDASVRVVAAARLRELGVAAAPAAAKLAQLLGDKEERVREPAAEALIQIGEPAVEPLIGQLTAKDAATRRWAVFTLAKLGPVAKAALSDLEKRESDDDPEIRRMAELAVRRLKMP